MYCIDRHCLTLDFPSFGNQSRNVISCESSNSNFWVLFLFELVSSMGILLKCPDSRRVCNPQEENRDIEKEVLVILEVVEFTIIRP